ncbi:MAG TPA: hypothetical protein VH877_25480, partial [Polyangia bacterium]|nr:hypothetical protein [Polyangia bacterium]
MPDPKRPPHPAKVGPPRSAQPAVGRAHPPHPATVQRKAARPASLTAHPPHPATVQRYARPASPTAKPPHPATVQRYARPEAVTPHPATVQRYARPEAGSSATRSQTSRSTGPVAFKASGEDSPDEAPGASAAQASYMALGALAGAYVGSVPGALLGGAFGGLLDAYQAYRRRRTRAAPIDERFPTQVVSSTQSAKSQMQRTMLEVTKRNSDAIRRLFQVQSAQINGCDVVGAVDRARNK